MSYMIVNNTINKDKNLKHTEYRILSYLIGHFNTKKGYAYPTRKQMIEDCGINKDTLNSVLNSLESNGYITRKKNPFRAGRNVIYYIHKHLYLVDDKQTKPEEVEETQAEVVTNIEEVVTDMPVVEAPVETVECEDLKQKVETVESVVGRKINKGFKKILEKLSWDEIVKVDMSLIGKTCNESYYLNAIFRFRPDLRMC